MPTYLVTGVNRGIGLALVDQLSQDKSNNVIGTVRNLENAKNSSVFERSNMHLIEIDFAADQATISSALKKLEELAPEGIDTVIHNAGVLGAPNLVPFDQYDAEDYLFPYQINVIGSVKFYKAVSPYLYKGSGTKRFGFISSVAGQLNSEFKFHGYGASKVALNYFMKQVFADNEQSENPLKKQSVVISIHPGLVLTDTALKAIAKGGSYEGWPDISAETSAENIITTLSKAESGLFYNYDGTVLDF